MQTPSKTGIVISGVNPGSIAEAAGLRAGDTVLGINGVRMRDVIDYMFNSDSGEMEIEYLRDRSRKKVTILADECSDMGITFSPMKVKTCRNNCIFCFVKQLPKGLRNPLYIKDEDYRLSFLYGNYTTLSNISEEEKKRIVEQRLSPMYISVHSTNMQIRNRMLGNPKASDIMKELKFFADNKIRMHVQIVLCPGYNDGKELQSTIRDIYRFYPYILSIAVVPVGLTRHRRTQLNPVSRDDARHALAITEAFQKRFKKKHGETLVYAADEMFIKAEMPFPPLKEYGELSQIENGVGMVPLFTSQMRRLKLPESFRKDRRFLTFTGTSFYPYLKKLTDRLRDRESCPIDLVSVENKFFGPSVSVTGLLTGRDIISAIHGNTDHYDVLIVPDVVLREGDTLLLDNVSLADLEYATGLKVITTDCTPQGLIDTITGEA